MSKEVSYICAQPKTIYYIWQLEVMISNFIEVGIDPSCLNILLAVSTDQTHFTNSKDIQYIYNKLYDKFPKVNFYEYSDTRNDFDYLPSIRPHILSKHFSKFNSLNNAIIFYHDCDIIFTKKPDFEKLLHDEVNYLSDTSSYLSAEYILSKSEKIYNDMCQIIGIDTRIPISKKSHGGAQYILKGIDSRFWSKVELDSHLIWKYFSENNSAASGLQIWTTDMWCLLWNLWLQNKETSCVPELDFCWSTDPISFIQDYTILHNAGITTSERGFCKQEFTNKLPYHSECKIKTNCSYYYFEQMKKYSRLSCLLS